MRRLIAGLSIYVLLLSACGGTTPEPVVTGVAYIGVTVSDLNQSVPFYTDSTDLQVVEDYTSTKLEIFDELVGGEGVQLSSKMLRGVNAQMRYMQFDNDESNSHTGHQTGAVPVNGPGIAHICFQVDDRTRTYQKFLEHGAETIGAKEMQQVNPRRPVNYAYAKDHDGIIFEVEHVDVAKLELDTPPKNKYRIRHVSLSTPNIKRLTKFYSGLLSQKKPRRIGRFGGVGNESISKVSGLADTKIKMTWFQTRNLELELVQYTSHPTELPENPRPLDAVGYNMIVFDVTDLVRAQQVFKDAGGQIISAPQSIEAGQIVFGRDPDMNLIGLQLVDSNAAVSSSQFKNNGI